MLIGFEDDLPEWNYKNGNKKRMKVVAQAQAMDNKKKKKRRMYVQKTG